MYQNPIQMIQQFQQFKNNFKGDPEQEVKRLMQSGQMSQQQFNTLQQQASQFMNILKNFKF